jgi:hypothetical protein
MQFNPGSFQVMKHKHTKLRIINMKKNIHASHTAIRLRFILLCIVCVGTKGVAGPSDYPFAGRESIEWCDMWMSHANETNLPRVLLIGDSMTLNYYAGVEKNLEGKAYVARLTTSAFVSEPILLKEIKMVLDEYRFDVIHINNGMHGWGHSEMEYKKALPKFFQTIQRNAPKAKLLWATLTPLRESPKLPADNQTEATNERIAARNAIALEFVTAKGIPVDDLNGLTHWTPDYYRDNVHFNAQGTALEAAHVAAQIEPLLRHLELIGRGQ